MSDANATALLERERFEAWFLQKLLPPNGRLAFTRDMDVPGEDELTPPRRDRYFYRDVQAMWMAWEARANE